MKKPVDSCSWTGRDPNPWIVRLFKIRIITETAEDPLIKDKIKNRGCYLGILKNILVKSHKIT